METKIALFQKKGIRKLIHENEWWFVVEDVVLALIESRDPKLKGLKRENLRDHMTDLELIFSMLGQAATTAPTRSF